MAETRRTGNPGRTSDSIVRDLRRMITTLELAPGSVLTEGYLTELLGCSRTPLREALQRLAQEHLIVAVPRRGVSVAELSLTDFSDLVETLAGMGDLVTSLAASRISDAELGELERILAAAEDAERTGNLADSAELDFEFHRVIIESCKNHYVIDAMLPLQRLVTRFSYVGFKRAGSASGALNDHRRLFDALRVHGAEAAVLANREHIQSGRERIKSAI